MNYTDVKRMPSLVGGIDVLVSDADAVCEPCIMGKHSNAPFSNAGGNRSNRILEIVHTDICGPITPTTWDGHQYFITFIDDFSHFTVVYLMKRKLEAFELFVKFKSMAETKHGVKIGAIRCDNGGEYTSKRFKSLCEKDGIQIQYSVPYTPQLNGVAERMNRTLVEKVRSMIADARVERIFWGEAIYCATFVLNRSPCRAIQSVVTPFELWMGTKPDMSKVRVFGAPAYAHVPDQLRTKLDAKSLKMTMVIDFGIR